MEGVDFSWGRPGAAALVAAGKKFVVRYITGSGAKAITATEIKEYRAAGLAIALVFESTTDRALQGYSAGVADAEASYRRMRLLGFPASQPIYFGVDVNTSPINYAAVVNYLTGAAQILGRGQVGVYGEYDLVKFLHENNLVRYVWQTYAWSSGRIYANAHLYQYKNGQIINGAKVDFCRSMQPDYGQWVAPVTLPDTSGVTMTFAVPKVPTVVPINTNGMLYVDTGLIDSPGAVKVFPGPREMPLHGMTADYYIVEYINEAGDHSGKAYFVKRTDAGTPKPVPPTPPVTLPATELSCALFTTNAVAEERRRVKEKLATLLEL